MESRKEPAGKLRLPPAKPRSTTAWPTCIKGVSTYYYQDEGVDGSVRPAADARFTVGVTSFTKPINGGRLSWPD